MSPRRRAAAKASSSGAPLLLLDAGHAAGWRRAVPDLDQLDAIVDAAGAVFDDTVVLAEAKLKWSLPDDQQERFEQYRGTSRVLCAPGGTTGGHHAFLAQVARAAAESGRDVWILSALSVGDGPWQLARLRRLEGEWRIEKL